jgi:hypothetical protein
MVKKLILVVVAGMTILGTALSSIAYSLLIAFFVVAIITTSRPVVNRTLEPVPPREGNEAAKPKPSKPSPPQETEPKVGLRETGMCRPMHYTKEKQ